MSTSPASDATASYDDPVHGARWAPEDVLALAPSEASVRAAVETAEPARWAGAGADTGAVWGRCVASSREPYDVIVEHRGSPGRRTRSWCSCPSRRRPCKHALGLLLAWAHGEVPDAPRPAPVRQRLGAPPRDEVAEPTEESRRERPGAGGPDTTDVPDHPDTAPTPAPTPTDRRRGRDERMIALVDGLVAFDRWLLDRVRLGLADESVRDPDAWDQAAARLVDAGARSLANRVRRVATTLASHPEDPSERLATDLGTLHLLTRGALRMRELPPDLADAVATSTGWQIRRADVQHGVPEPGTWLALGRNDTREDRIEVRRTWLRSIESGRWAMILSFAGAGAGLEEPVPVGHAVVADLYRYPGATYPDGSLRVLVGAHGGAGPHVAASSPPGATDVASARSEVGALLAREPWTERVPAVVVAAPARSAAGWVLTDEQASVPLVADERTLAIVLAASEGRPLPIMVEWTGDGAVPVSIAHAGRLVDLGRRAS